MIATSLLRKAMHAIAARKGDFTLFSMFKRANGLGDWDLVASAPWLDSGDLDAKQELVDLFAKVAGRKSLIQLASIQTIPGKDPTLRFILDTYPVEDGERRLGRNDLFGLEMDDAIILRAKRPERKKRMSKALEPVGAGSARARG